MKKYLRVILVGLLIFAATSNAEAGRKGEKIFGVHTGYVSRNRSADLGLFFRYAFSDNFRLQPSADMIFRHDDRDAFIVDLNAQYLINIGSENFSLYPFAGLNFSSWNRHIKMPEWNNGDDNNYEMGESSTRSNYFGVNFGAGFDLKVTSTLSLSIEAGYTLVKSNSGVRLLAGIGYIF